MGDLMGEWRTYIKQTKPGYYYYYTQRNVPGQRGKTEGYSLGPVEPRRKKRSLANRIGIALVGVEDEYMRPHNSLLNHIKEKRAAQREAREKGAREKGEAATEAVPQSSSGPSDQQDTPADSGEPSQSEN